MVPSLRNNVCSHLLPPFLDCRSYLFLNCKHPCLRSLHFIPSVCEDRLKEVSGSWNAIRAPCI